jgi:GNAT superfamily N-acetyltransferase
MKPSKPSGFGRIVMDAAQWRAWLSGDDAVAFIALDREGTPIGYIKAEAPQFDASYAVHGATSLAINGMYVSEAARGAGVGAGLAAALADSARESGKTMMSVDCETTDPEAYGFWRRWLFPLGWSLERRV